MACPDEGGIDVRGRCPDPQVSPWAAPGESLVCGDACVPPARIERATPALGER